MRRAVLLAAVVLAVIAANADARFNWTHRVTISGQFVNHWTVSEPGLCGTNGDGTVTVSFKNSKPIHTLVTRERGTRHWLLVGLYGSFHQTTFLPPQPATGSITTVDNTAPANATPDQPCDPIDKSHCGNKQLHKPRVRLAGLDAARLEFNLFSEDFRDTNCQIGEVTNFSDGDFFGRKIPELLVKMPTARSFFRKRTVTLTATDHKSRSGRQYYPDGPPETDDVTRTVTVTFTKR